MNASLQDNLFWILGATVRDDRRRIVELADENVLHKSADACHNARAGLLHPRNRLAAEVAWLPGVSPKKAEEAVKGVLEQHTSADKRRLPALAEANLRCAALEITATTSPEYLAQAICGFCQVVDEINPNDVLRDINEDRNISGFPPVRDVSPIEEELTERRRQFRAAIRTVLNRQPTDDLILTVEEAVRAATGKGTKQAPLLLDEFIDTYDLEVQDFLQREGANVSKLIDAVRQAAPLGEDAIRPLIEKMEDVARSWNSVAKPIQLVLKVRGGVHRQSSDLANQMRNLGVDLFNQHGLLDRAERMTKFLRELFVDLPELFETLERDSSSITDLQLAKRQADQRHAEWVKDITFNVEVGAVFKEVFSISPNGVEWSGKRYPLESITRVRWGGVRHSINGIPTGTTYTVAFGDDRTESAIEIRKEATYSAIVDKLWKAVCVNLITRLLTTLAEGQRIVIGGAEVDDDGVWLVKHKLLAANETLRFNWGQVKVWSADGSFYIGAIDDKKAFVSASYIHHANTHLLEQVIRLAFKKGTRKLSQVLQ